MAAVAPQDRLRWRRAATALEADIAEGRLVEGARLPSESALAERFGVNRHTVRRAIAELVKKGRLRSTPHGGTFVAPIRIPIALGARDRVSDAMERAGFDVEGRLLLSRVEPATAVVANALERPVKTQVIFMQHLHLINGLPAFLATTWVPADRFSRLPELYAVTKSLPRAFAQMGLGNYRRRKVTLTSRLADEDERGLIGLAAGAIVIVIKNVYVDGDGEPIDYTEFRFAADRVEFVFNP